jgi:hypothetical protein
VHDRHGRGLIRGLDHHPIDAIVVVGHVRS